MDGDVARRIRMWLLYLEVAVAIGVAALLGYLVGYLAGKTI